MLTVSGLQKMQGKYKQNDYNFCLLFGGVWFQILLCGWVVWQHTRNGGDGSSWRVRNKQVRRGESEVHEVGLTTG